MASRVPLDFSTSRVPTGFASTPVTSRVPSTFGTFSPSASSMGQSSFGVGAGGESLAEYRQSFMGRALAAQQRALLVKAGLPADADPAELFAGTSPDATDAGLAKIATANPELAETLQAKRVGAPEESKGFWDDLKDAAGDILDPVVAIGAKALDILMRPARIIPELIVDKENDAWYEDISQALSGKSHATGADVMEKWGVESGWAKAIGGFAFDVVADPLTWLTFGGAAVGRQVLTKTLGKEVFEGVARKEMGVEALKRGSKEAIEADEFVGRLYKEAKQYGFSTDAAEAVAGQSFNRLSHEGYKRAIEAHQKITQVFQTSGLSSLKKGGISLSDGTRIEGMEVLSWLNQTRKANLGSRANWGAAKAAAGAQGGIRFRAAVPFTSLRYISPAIPLTEGLQFFGSTRRFITGNAGVKRLNKAISTGQYGAKTEDLETFITSGWAGLRDANPDLVTALGSRGGGIFYPASEQIGKLTKRMTPQSAALRGGGIMALHADDFRRHLDGYRANLRTKLEGKLYKWNEETQDFDVSRELRSPREVEQMLSTLGKDPARLIEQHRWAELVPREARGNVAGWYDDKIDTLVDEHVARGLSPDDSDEIAFWTKRRDKAIKADKQLSPEEKGIIGLISDQQEAGRRELQREGVTVPDVTRDFEGRATLTEAEGPAWTPYNSVHARSDDGGPLAVYLDLPATTNGHAATNGVASIDGVHYGDRGYGFGGTTTAEPGKVKAFIRTSRPFLVDEQKGATQSGLEFVNDVRQRSDAIVDDLLNDAEWVGAHRQVGIDITEPGELARFKEEAFSRRLTAELQQVHKADSLIWVDKEGRKHITALRAEDVKVVNNELPSTPVMRGYVHRAETDAWMRFIQGTKDADLPRNWKRIKERLETKRAFIREDTDEAEAAIFDALRAEGVDLTNAPKHIFERDVRKLHGKWVNRAVEAGATSQAEWAGRKFGTQMEMAAGRPLGLQHFRWKSADVHPSVLNAMGDNVVRAATKISQLTEREMNRLHLRRQTQHGHALTLYRGVDPQYKGPGFTGFQRPGQQGRLWNESLWADEMPDNALGYGGYDPDNITQIMLKPESRVLRHTLQKGEDPFAVLEQAVKDGYDALVFHPDATGKTLGTAILNPEAIYRQRKMNPKSFERRSEWLDEQEERLVRDKQLADQERERSIAQFKTESARVTSPLERVDVAPAGFTPVEGIPGLEGLAMPAYMTEEIHRALRGPKGVGEIRRNWRRFAMGPWKRWSTVYYPGFHVRNFAGAWFNNAMGGVSEFDYVLTYRIRRASSRKANKWNDPSLSQAAYVDDRIMRDLGVKNHPFFKGKERVTYKDLADFTEDHAITAQSSGWMSEYEMTYGSKESSQIFPKGRARTAGEKAGKSKAGAPVRGYRTAATRATEGTENLFRTAAFLQGLKQTGGDGYGARAFAMMRHGDYQDLSDFEDFVRDLVPFYKWMRTNLPYQLRNLMENPAFQLSAVKAKDIPYVVNDMDPQAEQKKLPGWMQETFSIPFPKNVDGEKAMTYLTLDLPMSDLHQGANDFLGTVVPFLKPIAESYLLEKSMFTGAPLEGKMVPLAEWARLPGLREIISPFVDVSTDGTPMINDKVQNMLTGIPIYSRFRNFLTADPKRVKLRMNTFSSVFLGVGIRPQDEAELEANERAFFHENVQPVINRYRDLGAPLPSIDQVDDSVYTYLGLEPPVSETTEAPLMYNAPVG